MANLVLGVSGGIAAFKAVLLYRLLVKAGHSVRVVPTANSLRMVGEATWNGLGAGPVHTTVFEDPEGAEHVRLGRWADGIVVAPATADLLARTRAGRAEDLLGATLLMSSCPVILAPAMHTEMWEHPATQENVAVLRERGITVIEPESGELAGGDTGSGRLPEPETIAAAVQEVLAARSGGVLDGVRLAVSAGGTREPLDPVRFLGNRSSGRQGIAVALAAHSAGAEVTLVAANVEGDLLAPLRGITVRRVETTAELADAMSEEAADADVLVMAAAVADFRPAEAAAFKTKKSADSPLRLVLEQTEDILAGLVGSRRKGQTVVGFAAETGDEGASALEHAQAKARRKGADLLVFNEVSATKGFGDVPNEVTILDASGEEISRAAGTKLQVARALVDAIVAVRAAG